MTEYDVFLLSMVIVRFYLSISLYFFNREMSELRADELAEVKQHGSSSRFLLLRSIRVLRWI